MTAAEGLRRRRAGRPADQDSDETRAAVLAAARDAFAEKGYASTTLKEIARLADLSAGSVYYYFPSKGELFLAVDEHVTDTIVRSMLNAARKKATFAEKLAAMFDAASVIRRDDPGTAAFSATVRTEARRNPEISAAGTDPRWAVLFRELVSAGVATGEIAKEEAPEVRQMISAVFIGLGQMSVDLDYEHYRRVVLAFQHTLVTTWSAQRDRTVAGR